MNAGVPPTNAGASNKNNGTFGWRRDLVFSLECLDRFFPPMGIRVVGMFVLRSLRAGAIRTGTRFTNEER